MVWKDLISDGQKLLGKMHFGNSQLPSDWVSLYSDGRTVPAKQWPARFSYDAIRVPLYVYGLTTAARSFRFTKTGGDAFPRDKTPAWVNVTTGDPAPYMMDGGLVGGTRFSAPVGSVAQPQIMAQEDYYSASLKMLVALSVR